MAKAILEFDLSDRYDTLAHKRAIMSTDVYLALHDFDNELRNMTKYDAIIGAGNKIALPEGYHEITEQESILLFEVVNGIRNKLSNILEERGINMGDLE
jgi:hypothetical protein